MASMRAIDSPPSALVFPPSWAFVALHRSSPRTAPRRWPALALALAPGLGCRHVSIPMGCKLAAPRHTASALSAVPNVAVSEHLVAERDDTDSGIKAPWGATARPE